MAMMTAEQYEDSLRKLNLVVYMFGEQDFTDAVKIKISKLHALLDEQSV